MSSDEMNGGPKPVGELIPKLKRLPSLQTPKGARPTLEQRLFDYAEADTGAGPSDILHQHSVLCL